MWTIKFKPDAGLHQNDAFDLEISFEQRTKLEIQDRGGDTDILFAARITDSDIIDPDPGPMPEGQAQFADLDLPGYPGAKETQDLGPQIIQNDEVGQADQQKKKTKQQQRPQTGGKFPA